MHTLPAVLTVPTPTEVHTLPAVLTVSTAGQAAPPWLESPFSLHSPLQVAAFSIPDSGLKALPPSTVVSDFGLESAPNHLHWTRTLPVPAALRVHSTCPQACSMRFLKQAWVPLLAPVACRCSRARSTEGLHILVLPSLPYMGSPQGAAHGCERGPRAPARLCC